MRKTLVCGVGNALIDSEYRVSDNELAKLNLTKGCMELNNESNHINLSCNLRDEHGIVKMMPGGSVANSLYTLSQFSIDVSFIGKVSDDDKGKSFIKLLDDVGMDAHIIKSNKGITGECLVLITPDYERTMYTHLGVSSDLSLVDIDEETVKSSEYLLIEGYLVTSEKTKDVAKLCLDIASKNNIKKIITLSDPNVVSIFRDNMMQLLDSKFDIIFCNRQEAANISKTSTIEEAINYLSKYAKEVVVTSGGDGAYVSFNNQLVFEKCKKVEPVDLTGAGDMFLAAYLYAKTIKRNISECIKFANICSGEIIQNYGAKFNNLNDYQKLFKLL